jgi:hypothetical protein
VSVEAIAAIFSRCSSERPEKRGIVLKFLITYNTPVHIPKQLKFCKKNKKK